ncbi:MAG: GAF domain-containing SpoIIE family protein phosphatase [Edaphobacter sp.]
MGKNICVVDTNGKRLLGESEETSDATFRAPIELEGATLGFVLGPTEPATALASLLAHLAARESEGRALASEVLHLYREVHLIEQLSEQLAALLNLSAVGESALAQAQRLIPATHGSILVMEKADGPLRSAASFGTPSGDSDGNHGPLVTDSRFATSILERGIAEIINGCASDPRAAGSERELEALICAPLRAGQRTVGVIALANAAAGASYSAADLKLLNTIALQTAAAIENSLLCAEMVNAVRDREKLAAIQHELDTARTIQHLLVPRTFPPFPDRTDFDLHAQMTSAHAVGGDFFDFFLIDEDRLGVVIGDVSGKGIPAALYMAVTRTQVKTTALRGMTPAECLLEVNRVLVRERVNAMFATCFYGLLNLRSGEFHYCNAGHNLPYLLRAEGGAVEPIAEVGGIPLGMFDGMGYTGNTVYLQPGDALFLYTDGVPEARNAADDDFTDESLMLALGASATLNCQDLISHMTRKVSAFTDGAAQSDDITMLSVRRF